MSYCDRHFPSSQGLSDGSESVAGVVKDHGITRAGVRAVEGGGLAARVQVAIAVNECAEQYVPELLAAEPDMR